MKIGFMTNKQNVYIEEWTSLPWKKFEKTLFRLQHRLYKASKEKDIEKCKKLQSLILGSVCSRYLAVRQVTQLNLGKQTAGVDGLSALNPKERLQLADELKSLNDWIHQPLRRVYIPKPNGEFRPLGIPTIKDRAMQCLIKYALEPHYEANASGGSWGFRPGRRTHDVQKNIFNNLNSNANGHTKMILELDIEKWFAKINHEKLLSLIVLPDSAKKIIRSALKAGVLNERIKTLEGTPQGGVISPLLCNIALNGIEDLHNEVRGSQIKQRGLRYAADMIFFLKPGEDSILLRSKLDKFLAERGLKIKESKTQFVKSTEGFDFLGWHFKVKFKNNKFVSYPSKKNRAGVIKKIKVTMRDTRLPLEERLSKIKVIYRGWRNYHEYCDMSQVNTWSISNWVYRYGKKRSSLAKDQLLSIVKDIFNGHVYKVNGHTSVQKHKSPYDGDWVYWSKRQDLRYQTLKYKVSKRQNYQCGRCKLYFQSNVPIEIHHIDGNPLNYRYNNLLALHRFCHQCEPNHGIKKQGVVSD
jgi:group II intron reverse transcriptase/maturase